MNFSKGVLGMVRRFGAYFFVVVVAGIILILAGVHVSQACHAPSPLDGWHYGGDVSALDTSIRLGDHDASWSYAYKFVYQERGPYRFSFDFKNELSDEPYIPENHNFSFLDSFFASLYFINECSRFNLKTCSFDYVLPLFDMDYTGPFKVYQGQITPSSLGDDWLHYETIFTNHFHKVVPTLELFDENYIDNDSFVLIANVNISQVPIPSTFFLLGTGLLAFTARKFKSRSRPRK